MSSLRQQLQQQIGENNVLASKLLRKDQPSVMFDPREASDMDISAVYALGVNGLRSLVAIDQRFAAYHDSLFSQTARHYDRAFKTVEENAQLDKEIASFLVCLQPYILVKASIKCLEWLVRRFYIQDFNVDALLCCLLPYSDNQLFSKVVGICSLENTHWAFLSTADSASFGQRDFWVRRFSKDASLVTLICRMVSELHRYLSFSALVKIRVALYVSMVLPYLQSVNVDENVMLRVLPSIVDCLKSSAVEEMQTAAYIIISQLCDSVVLSETICQVFSKTILVTARNFEKALLCFLKLTQSQENLKSIPKETINSCIGHEQVFCKALIKMNVKYDCSRFFKIFNESLVDVMSEETLPFIQSLMVIKKFDDEIGALMCQKIISFGITSDSPLNQCANQILQKLNFIPEAVDFSAMSIDDNEAIIDNSLYLHLNSPNVEHRLKSAKIVIGKAKQITGDNETLQNFRNVYFNCLLDDSDEIVKLVINSVNFDLITKDDSTGLKSALVSALSGQRSDQELIMLLWSKLYPLISDVFEEQGFSLLAKYLLHSDLAVKVADEFNTQVVKSDSNISLIDSLSNGGFDDIKKLVRCTDKNTSILSILLLLKKLSVAADKDILNELPEVINFVSRTKSFTFQNSEFLLGEATQNFSVYCVHEIGKILTNNCSKIEWLVNCNTKNQKEVFEICREFLKMLCQDLAVYKDELQNWISTQFPTKLALLRFMSMIWIRNDAPSTSLTALALSKSILADQVVGPLDDVVLCVLSALGSSSRDCREMSITLLGLIQTHNLSDITSVLIQNRELIYQDSTFVANYILQHFKLSKDGVSAIAKELQNNNDPIFRLNILKMFGHEEKFMKHTVSVFLEMSEKAKTELLEDGERECLLVWFDISKTSPKALTEKQVLIYQNILTCNLNESEETTSFLRKFIVKLTREFFGSVTDLEVNRMFLTSLMELACKYPSLASQAKIAILNMVFTVDLLLSTAEEFRTELEQVNAGSMELSPKKSKSDSLAKDGYSVLLQKLELFLEATKAKKSEITDVVTLVPYFFELLTLLYSECANNDNVEFNYVMQLLIITTLEYVRMSGSNQAAQWDESLIRLDVLVQIIRSTNNPETRHSSIALISAFGKIYPEKVLRNIMPVFTFMGASMLQKDDSSSFNLTEQLIRATVPIIVEHHSDAEFSPLLFNILIVFANAFFHVPEHRRLHFYIVLAKALNVAKYLGLITLMILSRFSKSFTVADKRLLLDFLAVYLKKFTLEQRLKSMIFISDKLSELITVVGGDSSLRNENYRLFEMKDISGMKLFCGQILEFIDNCVSKQEFVDAKEGEYGDEGQTEIQSFVKSLMKTSREIRSSGIENADIVAENAEKCVKRLMFSVSMPVLVSVVKSLLKDSETDVHEICINVLKDRIVAVTSIEDDSNILELGESFFGVLQSQVEANSTKRSIISIMQMVSDRLKSENQQRLLVLFGKLIRECNGEKSLQLSILQLFSTLIANNGVRMLPYLKEGVQLVISSVDNVRLQVASLRCTEVLLKNVPRFLSPYLADLLKFISMKQNNGQMEILVAENVECRTLLPVIYKSFKECNNSQKISLMNILQHLIKNIKRDDVMNYYKSIFKFMLTCLDNAASDEEPNAEYEEHMIKCLSELVLKLNEILFKPLYLKVIDWALSSIDVNGKQIDSSISSKRKLILYRFTNYLLSKLTSIFANYYVNLIDSSIQIVADSSSDVQVWREVVDSLSKFFMYDNDFQITGEKNDKIIEVTGNMFSMISKFDMQTGSNIAKQSVIPYVSNYANMLVSSKQHTYLKNLNHKVLMSTRQDSPKVKLAALWSLEALYENIGEELLAHLPETVPFLAELLEDDDEIVEMTCRRVIKLVESHLGEALELK